MVVQYTQKDSESGDDVAQSGDSLVKAVSDQISIMRHTLLESEEKARQRSQEVARQLDESFQNLAQNLAQSVADMRRSNEETSALGGQVNLPQPPPQIQQVAGGPVQPDPVEAAPRAADLGQYINHDQIIDMVQEAYDPVLRPLVRPAYRKPYSDFIDQENPFPRGFKVLEFTLFSGDGGYSTIEHIGRFTIQCGEASGDDNPKLRLFPNSLTSTTLTWYLGLPQNSVYTWRQMEDLFHIQFYRSEPEVSMADLSRLEFVKLAQNGLDIELRKKFEGMKFCDFFELSYKVTRYENLLQEDTQRKSASDGTYYDKIDKGILRFPDKAKETMGVDAYPFPTMSVGVNTADLRSIARDRTQTYYRRRLAADDLRWVIEEARARRNQAQPLPTRRKSVWIYKEKGSTSSQNSLEKEEPPRSPTSPRILAVESNEETGLKVKFDMSDEAKNSSNVICFDLTEEEEVIEILAKEDSGMDSANKIIFEKLEERMARHIRPLYIHAHLDGMPINRVLVDNGAAVNVLPTCILHKIGKSLGDLMETEVIISDFTGGVNRSRGILLVELTVGNRTLMCAVFVVDTIATYNAFLERDWIHSSWCVPSTLHQKLIFWAGGRTEVVIADDKLFLENINAVEARYYDEDIGTIRFFGMDYRSEVIYEGEEEDLKDQITLEELDMAPAKLDDLKAEVQDPLEEVNLGTEADPKITFISDSLEPCLHDKIINISRDYKDCFAWDYFEMPGLDRNLVQHRLPIREDFKPFKQPPRRMSPEVTLKVKEEIERLLKVGFIRTSRYVEWLSNVVTVVKKNGKLRICVDFRNLNLATPKDEYPMPIADLLVDGAARYLVHERGLQVDQNKAKAVIEYMLSRPLLRGRIGKWVLALSEFNLKYMLQKAIKGQALANFLADHPCLELDFNCINNQAEYEVLIIGLEVLVELKLLEEFDDVILRHVTRDLNTKANEMAQIALGLKIPEGVMSRIVVMEKRILPSIHMCGMAISACSIDIHGPLQKVPASKLYPIVKPWPFRGWAIDLIGKVYPPSTRGHSFIIVATYYFTKWVEAKPMKKVDQINIIKFLKEEIIHRFGLPEIVTSDQGTVFVGAQVEAFTKEMGFRLLTSTPHYAQANGQAEASNRIVINLLEKMVDNNPRCWHELLSDTIWAYRTSQRSSTKVALFSLTYGHDAVLPMELSARSLRIAIQHGLTFGEYNEAMILELEALEGMRLTALDRLQT
ncbi:hypothetical protein SLEP1_g28883 [Rubroshorea leprosula]|uniref:Integrase catalytic domain-containing protein n=1 Tax=Rubroshorea leprosula TaxID=152421 RepID=A0AAV5K0T8_9ROSI|nr:hypothetical protein SLEP1_g28883 [Rubroshorea leprosula]